MDSQQSQAPKFRDEPPPAFVINDAQRGEEYLDEQPPQLESRLLSPSLAMGDNPSSDVATRGTPHNPFNFETQSISTSPVKSVRSLVS